MADVTIIMPVVRPDSAEKALEAALQGCGSPVSSDSFGDAHPLYLTDSGEIEVILEEDENRIGCPRMVKKLVGQASSNLIAFLGDDTEAQPGWLAEAIKVMSNLPDGYGIVGFSTQPGGYKQHWLAHKKMLPFLDGEFFHTGYSHNFCDDELIDRARAIGRYAMSQKSIILHHHPIDGETEVDKDYIINYENLTKDQNLYWKRKKARNGFRLGVGFPLVDERVHSQFFLSYICMDKPEEYDLLVPSIVHGIFPQSISAARNSIVKEGLDEGCSHILLMDTDQVYPAHTLTNLLKHSVDICGVQVHRRWPPFDTVMMRGELGSYEHVPDEECYSGKLVPVDATGTGCLLINTDVFIGLPHPWFRETTTPDGKLVGEDIYFCAQARQAGFEIYVDTSIEVGHLALREIGRGDYEIFKKLKSCSVKQKEESSHG